MQGHKYLQDLAAQIFPKNPSKYRMDKYLQDLAAQIFAKIQTNMEWAANCTAGIKTLLHHGQSLYLSQTTQTVHYVSGH